MSKKVNSPLSLIARCVWEWFYVAESWKKIKFEIAKRIFFTFYVLLEVFLESRSERTLREIFWFVFFAFFSFNKACNCIHSACWKQIAKNEILFTLVQPFIIDHFVCKAILSDLHLNWIWLLPHGWEALSILTEKKRERRDKNFGCALEFEIA